MSQYSFGFGGEEPTPDEQRQHGGGGTVAITIFVAVFVIPFILNLITEISR